uniref:CCHC-type domain-containing protein n=1 Tax=Peronospora matthiolae TaxID=2874970 RepID=A0AAV1UQM6_9STRA
MSVTQFSFKDLVSKLIAEEVRKKDDVRIEDETALLAGKRQEKKNYNKRSGGQRRTGFGLQCFNCGKRDQCARDCRKKKRDSSDRQEDHSKVAFNATQEI